MRKIAYLTPLYFADESYIGGGERHPTNLARGVAASGEGFSVELVSFGQKADYRQLAPGVGLRILPAARKPSNPLDVLSWDLPEAFADASLVHVHQAHTRCSEVGILVAKQLHKPICVTDHGGDSSRLGAYYGLTDLADRIVPVSDFSASFFQGRAPIEVIKGGVDVDTFTPPESPVERKYVLYVGRLLPHKGIDRLIQAVPSDMPLIVCGRPTNNAYFSHLNQLAAGKNVHFITDADDARIRELYRSAWVNVLPSVHRDYQGNYYAAPELMGFTTLEAMACGTPGIVSNLAGMPEFVRPGETGFVFDTIDELRERLIELVGDRDRVDALGRRAREVVVEEFSLEAAGRKMARLYDSLINANRPAEVAA